MAITSNPLTSTTAAAPAPGTANPLTLQAIQSPNVNPATLAQTPTGAIDTLANNAPQSLTSLLMPLYSQLFGAQSGSLASTNALQTQGNVAAAQSGAQQRGLTGSSIEAGAMQGATAAGQQAYTQGYASLLGQYVNQYAGAAGQDVANQQTYYGNLAQALGQSYASNVSETNYTNQLNASSSAAAANRNATQNAGIFGALGSIGGGLALGAMFSDIRLAELRCIEIKGSYSTQGADTIGTKFGFKVYAYEYDRARCPELNGRLPGGTFFGFMAHHVAEKYPKAVRVVRGYLMLDYNKLAELLLA